MRIKAEKGFSMIEILVALVILAIGLLGMATLMMNSLQTNQSAAWRSAATLAAYDLSERIRSNIDQSVESNPPSYAVDIKKASELSGSTNADDLPSCSGDSTAIKNCDLKVWAAVLNKSIPGSKVYVAREPVSGTDNYLYCIAIFWEDSGGKKNDDDSASACGQSVTEKNWSSYEVKVLQ